MDTDRSDEGPDGDFDVQPTDGSVADPDRDIRGDIDQDDALLPALISGYVRLEEHPGIVHSPVTCPIRWILLMVALWRSSPETPLHYQNLMRCRSMSRLAVLCSKWKEINTNFLTLKIDVMLRSLESRIQSLVSPGLGITGT